MAVVPEPDSSIGGNDTWHLHMARHQTCCYT
ncbi:hypothetical protein CEXT_82541, partial [Caerostris extrusa]